MTVYDIDPDVTPDNWLDHWKDVKDRGSFSLASHHRTRDGRLFPVEVTVNFVEVKGKEYICAFVRDITEQQQAEEARMKSEERLSLPDMTEDVFSKEFLRIRPDIPIIVCMSHSELISDKQAKEAGIKAYVSKPVTMHGLANNIRQALGNR